MCIFCSNFAADFNMREYALARNNELIKDSKDPKDPKDSKDLKDIILKKIWKC